MYSEAIKILDDTIPYIVPHTLKLGKPKYSTATKSGHVEIVDDELGLFINPNFEQESTLQDYAFYLAHETMHVLLGHLLVWDDYPDKNKLSIATDCIINDYLTSQGMMPEELKIFYGMDFVGYDCSHSLLEDVYNDLPDNPQPAGGEESVDDHELLWDGTFDGDLTDLLIDFLLVGGGNFPPDLADLILLSNDVALEGGIVAGSGFAMAEEPDLPTGVTMEWAKLLEDIDPDIWKTHNIDLGWHRSWRRHPSKLMSFYPDIILPAAVGGGGDGENKEKKSIVLALDTSSSIPRETQAKLIKLAKTIPQDKINVFCCTFSTNYVPFDINSENNRIASGGTSFGAVERYIQNVVYEITHGYPTAVVVISDLEANWGQMRPTKENLKSWTFLATTGRKGTYDTYANSLVSIERLSKYVVK